MLGVGSPGRREHTVAAGPPTDSILSLALSCPFLAFSRDCPTGACTLAVSSGGRWNTQVMFWREHSAQQAYHQHKDGRQQTKWGQGVLCPFHQCAFNCFMTVIICLLGCLEFCLSFKKKLVHFLKFCKITWPIWKLQARKPFICRSQLFSLADGWACESRR